MQYLKKQFKLIKNSINASDDSVAEFVLNIKEFLREGRYSVNEELLEFIEWIEQKNALDLISEDLFYYITDDKKEIGTTFLRKYWKIYFKLGLISEAQSIENQIINKFLIKKRYHSIIEFSKDLTSLGDVFSWQRKSRLLISMYEQGSIWQLFTSKLIIYDDIYPLQKIISSFEDNKKLQLENELILGFLRDQNGKNLNRKQKKKIINSIIEYLLRFPEAKEIYEIMGFYLSLTYRKGIYTWLAKIDPKTKVMKSLLSKIDTKKLKHSEVLSESRYDAGADLFEGEINNNLKPRDRVPHNHYLNRSPAFLIDTIESCDDINDDKLINKWLKSANTIESHNAKDLFVAFLEMSLFKAASHCLEYMKINKTIPEGELYYFTALIKFHLGQWQRCCQECLATLVRVALSESERTAFIVLCARAYHELGKNNEAASILKNLDPAMIKGLVKLL